MNTLLINEPPLQVLPSLAQAIGLNEAIILQQIHYWLDPRMNKNKREGVHWVYNSYEQWHLQFCFMSKRTIQRSILSLEKQNLLISKKINKPNGDSTKWYTINYEKLNKIEASRPRAKMAPGGSAKLARPLCQNGTTIYKETEITTEITNSSLNPSSLAKPETLEKGEEEKRLIKKNKGRGESEEIGLSDSLKNPSSHLAKQGRVSSCKPQVGMQKSISFDSAPEKNPEGYKNQQEKTSQQSFIPNPIAQKMLETWSDVVKEGEGRVYLQEKRQQSLLMALETYFEGDLGKWTRFCQQIASSKFLMGETESQFSIKIDWVLRPETIEKILEGSYTVGDRDVWSSELGEEEKKEIEKYENKAVQLMKLQPISWEKSLRCYFYQRVKNIGEGRDLQKVLRKEGFNHPQIQERFEAWKASIIERSRNTEGKPLKEDKLLSSLVKGPELQEINQGGQTHTEYSLETEEGFGPIKLDSAGMEDPSYITLPIIEKAETKLKEQIRNTPEVLESDYKKVFELRVFQKQEGEGFFNIWKANDYKWHEAFDRRYQEWKRRILEEVSGPVQAFEPSEEQSSSTLIEVQKKQEAGIRKEENSEGELGYTHKEKEDKTVHSEKPLSDRGTSHTSSEHQTIKSSWQKIKEKEKELIEKIIAHKDKEKDYKEILELRIKEGMEGKSSYELLQKHGWNKAGFDKKLRDYQSWMHQKAYKHAEDPNNLSLFSNKHGHPEWVELKRQN